MAAYLSDAYDYVVAALEAAGLTVTTDPRNVRPPCVLVEPPTVTAQQNTLLAELEFPIIVAAPGLGNKDATAFLLDTVDEILGAGIGTTTGGPTVYTIGNQELPAYQLTTTIQIRRN